MKERIHIREGMILEGADGGTLLANKCKSCGQVFFPKAILCFNCFNEDMVEQSLSGRGELYSYTVSHMASLHFDPPYAIGWIELPEGVRIMAPLKVAEGQQLKVGMNMELVIEQLWLDGNKEIIGYKFRPV